MGVRPPRAIVALIASALLLGVPSVAGAAPVQFGSPLTPGPSGAFGCNAIPLLSNSPTYGDVQFFQNTFTADCTWRQSGVYGSITDPRTSGVPGDGRIIGAEILSGPNPAPVQISVLRQLNTPGMAGQCCFFVSETPPVALLPNAVTAIPLNIPVERNTLKGVLAADLMALTAVNGAGTLPVREVGPHNTLTMGPGSVVAGYFYPKMGANPNDSGGGRREEAMPGIEVLVRWTWCANGDASCDPTLRPAPPAVTPTAPPAGPAAIIAPTLAQQLAQVRENQAFVRLLCGTDAACQGRLELIGRPLARQARASAPGGKPVKPAKPVVYGSAGYKLSAGAKGSVAVKLNRRGKALLAKRRQATVTLRIAPKGGAISTAKLTLKRSDEGAKRGGKGASHPVAG